MPAEKVSKRVVVKAALKIVDLDRIKTDRSYQREVNQNAQRKIVQRFNPEALGIPVIGERDDGSLWIVDGLQRITALATLGKRSVRAEVFASKGPEHEAQVFHDINRNRVPLKPLQIFHAALTAGDKVAWEIKDLVERMGFWIPPYIGGIRGLSEEKVAKAIRAINSVNSIYEKSGAEGLKFVLEVVSRCWANDESKTRDTILLGLHIFWVNREKSVDIDRLVDRLNTTTPQKIVYSGQLASGGRVHAVGAVIDRLYRKHMKK